MTQKTTMMEWTLANAIDYARAKHEAVDPGYFDSHVLKVLEECQKHTENPTILVAAILHDILEDTDATFDELVALFGWTVAYYVDGVTDAKGYSNRRSRKLHSYYKIRRHIACVLIKLCDRKQNLQRCITEGESARFGDMYLKEEYTFKAALWQPDVWSSLWQDVDDLIEQVKERNLVNGKRKHKS